MKEESTEFVVRKLRKKVLTVLCVAVILTGCASVPMSSVYEGAKPSRMIANGDGTTTFEFQFPYDNNWDGKMAMQRINEYLKGYANQNGFSGYDTVNVDGRVIEKTNGGSAIGAALQDWGSGLQGSSKTHEAKKDQFVRVLVEVKFKI